MLSPLCGSGQRAMSPAAKMPGRAGLEIGVDDDAAIDGEPGPLGELDPRAHADAGDHEIRLERAAAFELHLLAVDGARRLLEVEDDAVLLMERAHEVAHLRAEDSLHRPFVRRHHVDLDVAGAQRGRDLEPDEARADHDGPARRRGALDDRPAVGERAQREDVRLVGAGDRQANRLGAGREQQPVVRDRAPVGERDLARAHIDAGDAARRGAGRCRSSSRSCPRAAAPNPRAPCRRGSPSRGWAGRRAARRHCSA